MPTSADPGPGAVASGRLPRVLTIAGSDSGGGAGIQADLKTMLACGVHGMSVLTAITAQNSVGVQGAWELDLDAVRAQFRSVVDDIGVDAVKTGMLASAAMADCVADLEVLRKRVVPLATVLTPNLTELGPLADVELRSPADREEAAARLLAAGADWVLVKGGHDPGDAVDVLHGPGVREEYRAERLDNRHTHGTGCTLASAIASHLAQGYDVPAAVAAAKTYVTGAIRSGFALGTGIGPVDHAWPWRTI